jgi:DNA-binding response OmpR family regulator
MLTYSDRVPVRVTYGDLSVDILSGQAFVKSENLFLSQKEAAALTLFIQFPEKIMSAEYVYERIWGLKMAGSDNAIRVTLSKLRAKLAGSGYTITASRGEGYYLERE